jgi:CNT family concentrative nucleoside transporter
MFAYLLEYNRYLNIVGIIVIAVIAWAFSHNRKAINKRLVFSALALHFGFAILMLRTSWGQTIMQYIADGASKVYIFAEKGIDFMFGKLGDSSLPWGFVFAFKVLPVIIFVGALTGLLYHWGIIQKIVIAMNAIIRPIIGASGVETISAIANSILGQTEASLFMSNYIHVMTRSELFVLMCSGMASISISVLVIYTLIGMPGAHLLTASVMSIPASIFIAKILLPETEKSTTVTNPNLNFEKKTSNSFDAISKGTMDGLQLALAVAAMLISFLALIAMGDYILAAMGSFINYLFSWHLPQLSIAYLLSFIFAPFAFLLGLTGSELWDAGKLLGIKVSVNEMIAFSELAKTAVSPRTFIILVYALCGFSNFSCIGIQIGMINALAPEKKHTVTQLGLYAVLGSSLANLLSAMIVGLLL